MFKILKKDSNSNARLGVIETPHGTIETPSFVVVGTHAKVRELTSQDLVRAKTQLIIANTYHMWQKLGDKGLKKYPGLHEAMNWQRPLMTDSGGFQVFSLGFARELGGGKIAASNAVDRINTPEENLVRITEEGVYFKVSAPSYASREARALEGGQSYFLSPKKSVWIQEKLGADIILAFDEPTSPLHSYEYNKEALARTHKWGVESLKAKTTNQKMYGIVQGGLFENLRNESAKFIASLDFDGFALGGSFGSSFGGEGRSFREIDWMVPFLPENKPRHLLGIGLVHDIFVGVSKGVDTFDCVVPTREGRHGHVYTSKGRFDINKGLYRHDETLLSPECDCAVCVVISKGELHQLFKDKNPRAGYLASFHNIYFFNNLMEKIRKAIKDDRFKELMSNFIIEARPL